MYVPQPDDPAQRRGGDSAARLPNWHELLAAFCGHVGDDPDAHPVTSWARELAELHLTRRESPLRTAEIDCRRAEIVAHIDDWIAAVTHTRRPAPQSLGAEVDAMAAAQVRAVAVLRVGADVGEERVHSAWSLLAALADEWTELVRRTTPAAPEAAAGRRAVPVFPPRAAGQ
ncbi:hypothetical protein [Nocardia vaccinii]|uniref:hypothetical protein n=1 Tax=Nocardia vaccinii TaxID=1822 RepID=UPI000830290C|nr:hypothetical protein [Nocardia vaccinii]